MLIDNSCLNHMQVWNIPIGFGYTVLAGLDQKRILIECFIRFNKAGNTEVWISTPILDRSEIKLITINFCKRRNLFWKRYSQVITCWSFKLKLTIFNVIRKVKFDSLFKRSRIYGIFVSLFLFIFIMNFRKFWI